LDNNIIIVLELFILIKRKRSNIMSFDYANCSKGPFDAAGLRHGRCKPKNARAKKHGRSPPPINPSAEAFKAQMTHIL